MKRRLLIAALTAAGPLMAQVNVKVVTDTGEQTVENARRITFDENLSVQTIHDWDGHAQDFPLRDVRGVWMADTVHSVADYVRFQEDCKIFNWAIWNGIDPAGSDYMRTLFFTHFADPAQVTGTGGCTPSLGSRFALFVPTDAAMLAVPLPLSFASLQPVALRYQLRNADGTTFPVSALPYRYNSMTGEVKTRISSLTIQQSQTVSYLREMLLQHTVFFDRPEDRALGIRSGNEYFRTLGGTVVRVAAGGDSVQGGFQADNARKGLQAFNTCRITDRYQKHDGTFYKIDQPILPTAQTAWDVLQGEDYEEFFKLCRVDEQVLAALGMLGDEGTRESRELLNYYRVFVDEWPDGTYSNPYGLSFFPQHPFTLYAPTNEAVRQAIAEGLPTWESLAAEYAGGEIGEAAKAEGQAKVMRLLDFVRYHFHFGTEFADKLPFAGRSHRTPLIDANGVARKLTVSSAGNGQLTVTDATGTQHPVMDEGKNTVVHNVVCARPVVNQSMSGAAIEHTSPGVIHRINSVLRYE